MKLRVATPADGASIFEIYSYYIENDTATFEISQITAEIMSKRIAQTLPSFPYLVCEIEGTVVGFAYAHRLGEREAFDFGAELCIYLSHRHCGGGVGTALYGALMALLREQGICNAYAGVTHENLGSLNFHRKFGFVPVGQIPRAGYKFGRWLDLCWLFKPMDSTENPVKVKHFSEIDNQIIQEILNQKF